MNTVLILGAGLVTKPMADYFIDRCGYRVVLATRTVSKAERIIGERPLGEAVSWTTDRSDVLDDLVRKADLVVSMIPPTLHIPVAEACLKHRTNMVTTSYISPAMDALDEEARRQGIIILNEIGEDPGMDHMGAKQIIDQVRAEQGEVISLTSYGAGLPAFQDNRNPFGYKFSWSPKGVMLAAHTPAAYLRSGERVEVCGGEPLFAHHRLVDLEGIGTFETYPNRDCTRYLPFYELESSVSLYRGLLRFTGYCNTMRALIALGALDDSGEKNWEGKTYAQYTASLIGGDSSAEIRGEVAKFLEVEDNADVIKRMGWLGLFDERPVGITRGAIVDVLVHLMLQRMSYEPGEQDMIIVRNEIEARFSDRIERRSATMMVEGIPHGDSAMSRAVSLPAAVAGKLILEGRIEARGVQMPTLAEIYGPVLNELTEFGFGFVHRTEREDPR